MPMNGCSKPFVGINLCKKEISHFFDSAKRRKI
jgi:hypothetical protein